MSATLVGILLMGGLTLYAVVGVLGARKLLHGKVVEGHNDVVVPMFLTAGVIYAVLLGFLVIGVWETYADVKGNAASEAAALVPLYRVTQAMPEETGKEMRELVRAYTEAVVDEEWKIQAETGKPGPKARKAIGDMFRAFGQGGAINAQIKKDFPFVCTAFMNAINEVSVMRNKRIIQAQESLPTIMWIASIGGALFVISMGFMPFMEKTVPHVIMAGTMSMMIGFLLFNCYLLSHVFNGPLAISPEPFENTMTTLDGVDKGF